MSTVGASDFDEVIERNHRAIDEFAKGDSKPLEELYSRRDDVSLGNPFGPFVRGFEAVAKTMERAATLYRDGRAVGFDSIAKVVAADMAFMAEVERIAANIGGHPDAPVSLRCTSVFRREDGEWRLVHRHADPITTPQAAESVIEREASV
jgi:ketosteroid isomerase-like protein